MSVIPASGFIRYNKPLRLSLDDLASAHAGCFRTHDSKDKAAAFCHKAAHILSTPFRLKLPFSLLSFLVAAPFQIYSHSRRPIVSVVHNPDAAKAIVPGNTLSVRTHNLEFVYEFFRVVGDLRAVKTRAEVIFFQEAFHIDGTKELVNQLKAKYPYVVHSIVPHVMGLNNGGIIASQHFIEELTFRAFDDMMGPEKLSTRGLLKNGANQADAIVLLGDLNASKVTAWGEKSEEDDGVFDVIDANFVDVFGNDHDSVGKRTSGKSQFAVKDTPEGVDALEEPSGSWFIGPFAAKEVLMRFKEWYERKFNNIAEKQPAVDVPKTHHWGTKQWFAAQRACSARFDFILRYLNYSEVGLHDRAEIRRVKVDSETQSAPSDHAPIDGVIKL